MVPGPHCEYGRRGLCVEEMCAERVCAFLGRDPRARPLGCFWKRDATRCNGAGRESFREALFARMIGDHFSRRLLGQGNFSIDCNG
jgi:hypothetical protein